MLERREGEGLFQREGATLAAMKDGLEFARQVGEGRWAGGGAARAEEADHVKAQN